VEPAAYRPAARFAVVYHLLSITHNHRLRLKVFCASDGAATPWVDMAAITNNPKMKSENVLFHGGWLYVTSGDGYGYQAGADGTVYRVKVTD
jgi:hypothetical protein